MNLLRPQGLWLSGFLPIIVLIYFRKQQTDEIRIPTLRFFEEIVKEEQGIKIKNIDRYLLLLLQLLVAIFIVLSVADPIWVKGNENMPKEAYEDQADISDAAPEEELHIQGGIDHYTNTLFYKISNLSNSDKELKASLYHDFGEEPPRDIIITSGSSIISNYDVPKDVQGATLKVSDLSGQITEYKIDRDKALPRIVYIGDNPYMEKALSSIASIEVDSVEELSQADDVYSLYIIETKVDEAQVPRTSGVWYFKPEDDMIRKFSTDEKMPISFGDSPIVKGLSLRGIYIKDDFLQEKKDYQIALTSNKRPILIHGVTEGQKRIYTSMNLANTNIYFSPDFPVLVNNGILWLLEEDTASSETPTIPMGSSDDGYALKDVLTLIALLLLLLEGEVYRLGF